MVVIQAVYNNIRLISYCLFRNWNLKLNKMESLNTIDKIIYSTYYAWVINGYNSLLNKYNKMMDDIILKTWKGDVVDVG